MTDVARKLEEASRIILSALDAARKRGEEHEEFYRKAADAYVNAVSAIHYMRAYGKIDPKTYEEIDKTLREELF